MTRRELSKPYELESELTYTCKCLASLLKKAEGTDLGMPRIIAITELLTFILDNYTDIELFDNALFRSTFAYKCNDLICEDLCTPELERVCRAMIQKIYVV